MGKGFRGVPLVLIRMNRGWRWSSAVLFGMSVRGSVWTEDGGLVVSNLM